MVPIMKATTESMRQAFSRTETMRAQTLLDADGRVGQFRISESYLHLIAYVPAHLVYAPEIWLLEGHEDLAPPVQLLGGQVMMSMAVPVPGPMLMVIVAPVPLIIGIVVLLLLYPHLLLGLCGSENGERASNGASRSSQSIDRLTG